MSDDMGWILGSRRKVPKHFGDEELVNTKHS